MISSLRAGESADRMQQKEIAAGSYTQREFWSLAVTESRVFEGDSDEKGTGASGD